MTNDRLLEVSDEYPHIMLEYTEGQNGVKGNSGHFNAIIERNNLKYISSYVYNLLVNK